MEAVQLTLLDDLFDGAPPALAGLVSSDQAACAEMAPEWRRQQGVTLTPQWLVEKMLDRVAAAGSFDTLVDAGAGTGRFAIAAARRFPAARVVCVERNEAMLVLLRQALLAAGISDRVQVVAGDFRDAAWPRAGRTAFIGNPPYVRHHDIEPVWKRWYGALMAGFGLRASQLAGQHLHFLARVAEVCVPGDLVCFVTSAEWLDNGYGQPWRQLLSRPEGPLSLRGLWVAEPAEPVFTDALVSAAVFEAACGPVASTSAVELGSISGRALITHWRMESAELLQSQALECRVPRHPCHCRRRRRDRRVVSRHTWAGHRAERRLAVAGRLGPAARLSAEARRDESTRDHRRHDRGKRRAAASALLARLARRSVGLAG